MGIGADVAEESEESTIFALINLMCEIRLDLRP